LKNGEALTDEEFMLLEAISALSILIL